MTDSLEPDYANLSDIRVWFEQSVELIRRRWMLFLASTILYAVVSYLTVNMGLLTLPLGLLITQAFVMAMLVAAKVSDDSSKITVKAVLEIGKRLIATLLLIALITSAIILVALFVGSYMVVLLPDIVPTKSGVTGLIDKVAPAVMRFFFLYCVITMSAMWFLLPLLLFHRLKFPDAVKLAWWGWRRNEIVILMISYTPMLSFVILLLFWDLAMVLCLLLFPLFAVMLYVSYRHIYRKQKSNSPAKALASFVEVGA